MEYWQKSSNKNIGIAADKFVAERSPLVIGLVLVANRFIDRLKFATITGAEFFLFVSF